jgi:hypothetical protein
LSRVAEAQTNIKESRALRLLGLTQEDLKGDPADVAIKALQGGARIASRDKASGRPVGSDPYLELFSNAERIRLRDHPEEVDEMVARMRADQKNGRLNLSPADQKAIKILRHGWKRPAGKLRRFSLGDYVVDKPRLMC